jgi:hypothetical protein
MVELLSDIICLGLHLTKNKKMLTYNIILRDFFIKPIKQRIVY